MIPTAIYAQTLQELLAPVRCYLDDPSVSEIMINGPTQIFVERRGKLELTSTRFESAGAIMAALRNVAQYAGTFVDEQHPILEARLPDGARVEAVVSPIAEHGPVVSIRRFSRTVLTLPGLVELDALSGDAAEALHAIAVAKCNILVAGGTGSGKTSLLNVLAGCVPAAERLLVLEDTREIEVDRAHIVYLTARQPDEQGQAAVSIRELFRAALRMRPDRIIVGEIRGAEALDMVQAMVSGHGGCLSTLHASYPRDTLTRLETMCMMSDVAMPLTAIRMQIASGIDVIVQLARLTDGTRKITHITEVVDYDPETNRYELRDLFERKYTATSSEGRVRSRLLATGQLPSFLPRLQQHGVELPKSMASKAEG
jgi:pilus assembly protein CpaF